MLESIQIRVSKVDHWKISEKACLLGVFVKRFVGSMSMKLYFLVFISIYRFLHEQQSAAETSKV